MATNDYTNQNATAPNIALAHTIAGEPVDGKMGVAQGGNIQLAGLHSMAPYRPPKRRKHDNPDVLLCSFEDCKAYPIKSIGYCAGHAHHLGLVKYKKGGRKPAVKEPDVVNPG